MKCVYFDTVSLINTHDLIRRNTIVSFRIFVWVKINLSHKINKIPFIAWLRYS